jgi:hypothetical protein
MQYHRWNGALGVLLALAGVGCGNPAARPPAGDDGLSTAGVLPRGTSLLVQVLAEDGAAIPSAALTVRGQRAVTDGVGRLLFQDLDAGLFAARAEAAGFAPASVAVTLPEGAHAGARVHLRPLGPPLPFDADLGGSLASGGARLTLPPGALVDAHGAPATGPAEATLVVVDPASDLLPGPRLGLTPAGDLVGLHGLALADVTLWQGGQRLQIAPGAHATLELPLTDAAAQHLGAAPGAPAFWLDVDAGRWRQEGAGQVVASTTTPGRLAWTAQVAHLSWWSGQDPEPTTRCYVVTVVGPDGQALADQEVTTAGTAAAGTFFTDRDGATCVDFATDGRALEVLVGPIDTPLAKLGLLPPDAEGDCSGDRCTPITITVGVGDLCTPGASRECPYMGPPGTVDRGLCRAAVDMCDTVGDAWTGCVGEVLPAPERCDTADDDNCDGSSVCAGQARWARQLGTDRTAAGVATDAAGDIFLAGSVLQSPGDNDAYVTKLDPEGNVIWSLVFGDGADQQILGMAVDADGNVVVAGRLEGTVDFGGGPLTSKGGADAFVARLSGASGAHLWSRRYGGEGIELATHVAVDADGAVILAGHVEGLIDFGGPPILGPGPGPTSTVFLAKLDPKGGFLWSRAYHDPGGFTLGGLAVDSLGDVVLVGGDSGGAGFGAELSSAAPGAFVTLVRADGADGWSLSWPGGVTRTVVVDQAGPLAVAGEIGPAGLDLGAGPEPGALFFAWLDRDGALLADRLLPGEGYARVESMTAGNAAGVWFTGSFAGWLDAGGGAISTPSYADVYLTQVDAFADHVWSEHVGGAGGVLYQPRLALSPGGGLIFVATLTGAVHFGLDPYSADAATLTIAELNP